MRFNFIKKMNKLEKYPLNTHVWEEYTAPVKDKAYQKWYRCSVCGEVVVSSCSGDDYFISAYSAFGNLDLRLRTCSERLMQKALG